MIHVCKPPLSRVVPIKRTKSKRTKKQGVEPLHRLPFPLTLPPHLELSLSQVCVMQLLVAHQGAQLHLNLGVPVTQRHQCLKITCLI